MPSFGTGFGSPDLRSARFSGQGSSFTASYHNSRAVDVVRQLAALAQFDPWLTKSSLQKLELAAPDRQEFSNVTPRKALDGVLAGLGLKLTTSDEGLLLVGISERSRTIEPLDNMLQGLGLESQLQRPFLLMAFQTPLRMFLQSASMQLGVEIEVDDQKLKINPQTSDSIQPFSASTLGESLQAGLASTGLEYRIVGGRLVIGPRVD